MILTSILAAILTFRNPIRWFILTQISFDFGEQVLEIKCYS